MCIRDRWSAAGGLDLAAQVLQPAYRLQEEGGQLLGGETAQVGMVTQPVQGMHLAPVTGVAQGVVDLVAHQVDILVVQGQADKDRHRRTGTKPELPAVQQVQHHLAVRGGGQRGEENPAQTVAIVSVSYTHLDVYKRQG